MYGKKTECDIDSILNVLGDKKTESDVPKIRRTLKEALVLQTKGTDTELLFPVVVKYIASNDMVSKKIAYNFISHHGHRQDLILLAINCLLKDCNDPSPMTRGLALRTLTDLPNQADYSVPQVLKALDDSSAYVRRVAVMACVKVSREYPELVETHGFVDLLYDKIRDNDPIVVANCLNGLDELLSSEGGAVINKNIAYHLLNNLRLFSDWSLVSILKFLRRYTPESEDEIYAVMNLTDQNLSSNNATVVIATMEYFLFLVRDLPHLTPDIFERASAKLLHILSLGHPEINHALLRVFLEKLDDREYVHIMQEHYESFYCRQTDPLYIKAQKMEILPHLVNSANLSKIIAELALQSSHSDAAVVQLAIKTMGKIAVDFKDTIPLILPKFAIVLSKRNCRSTSEVLQTLQKLDILNCGEKDTLLEHIENAVNLVEDVQGKCALFVLLGKYGKHIADAPYVIETFIASADQKMEEDLLCELMSCTVNLFKCRPAECQEMLGRLLETCYEDGRVEVQDRANFYYALLKAGLVKRVD